jgi:hypothetical protein
LSESGSPYTLPTLIDAFGEVINQLTRAMRHTTEGYQATPGQDP